MTVKEVNRISNRPDYPSVCSSPYISRCSFYRNFFFLFLHSHATVPMGNWSPAVSKVEWGWLHHLSCTEGGGEDRRVATAPIQPSGNICLCMACCMFLYVIGVLMSAIKLEANYWDTTEAPACFDKRKQLLRMSRTAASNCHEPGHCPAGPKCWNG